MKTIINEKFFEEIKCDTAEIIKKNQVAPIDWKGYRNYLFKGDRLTFENQYFERRRQLATLALSLNVSREQPEVIDFLEEVIWEICNEYTWALPAHLKINPIKMTFDYSSSRMIDLFAAETAQTLSEIMELHELLLSAQIKKRIRIEIENRVLLPFEEKQWEWERLENNWSAVIAGCIGMTTLSLLPYNSHRQNQIIKRLENSFDKYLSSFGDDGACVEGIAYWTYGFGYYCYFAEKYQEKFKDDKFLKNTKLKAIAAFPFYTNIGKNRFLPFSDSHESEIPSGLLTFCRKVYKVSTPSVSRINSLHFDHCYRWAHLYRSLIWTEINEEEDSSFYHYFENSEWLIIKNIEEEFVFAAKGGRNDESHNHNDSGHFLIGCLDELLLTDFGAGEYTKDYFDDDRRYHLLNNRSLGHSVPLINGTEQQAGDFGTKNATFEKKDEKIYFSLNLQESYTEKTNMCLYKRLWKCNPKQQVIELEDQINFASEWDNTVTQNFVSEYKPVILNDSICWTGKSSKLFLNFQIDEDEPYVLSEKIQTHRGEEDIVYRTELRSKREGGEYKRKYIFRLEKF